MVERMTLLCLVFMSGWLVLNVQHDLNGVIAGSPLPNPHTPLLTNPSVFICGLY